MGFWQMLASEIASQIADKIVDEVIIVIRKRTRMSEIEGAASDLKEELKNAESAAEREAVLDKVYDLINGFDGV